jgi:ribosome-associated protein
MPKHSLKTDEISEAKELSTQEPAPSKNSELIAQVAAALGLEKKAFRPVILDLRGLSSLTDFFVILSATSSRQVIAIAEGIRQGLKQYLRLKTVSVDGMSEGKWALLDYGSVFVHVFQEPTRELYQLEQLWSKGVVHFVGETESQTLLDELKASTEAQT